MRLIYTGDYGSLAEVKRLLSRPYLDEVEPGPGVLARTEQIFGRQLTPVQAVETILADIKEQGDQGLLKYIRSIDGAALGTEELLVGEQEYEAAMAQVDRQFLDALDLAIDNVRRFHLRQQQQSWIVTEPDGTILGQRIVPLDKVAIYIPGGNAPLVSTVVMCAVPAVAAGVEEIWMATPLRDGVVDPHLLVAARRCGVKQVLKAGGAHAVAAFAFGTETIPVVDKIVGPGNLFVTLAKKMVFGRVGIESLAGPSEILVLADHTASAKYIAADLLSQAEHDWEAASCLVTDSQALAEDVQGELERQLQLLPDPDVARQSLERWGLLVVAEDMDEATELSNIFAPEHLELLVADPWQLLGKIRHAGAIFMGPYSPEPIGDYVAGPNHVLPTNSTARFSSALSVEDFVKKNSLIAVSQGGLLQQGPAAVTLAEVEGLAAHARAVQLRLTDVGQVNEEKGS